MEPSNNTQRMSELTLQMRSQHDRITHYLRGIRFDLFVLTHPDDVRLLRIYLRNYYSPEIHYHDMKVVECIAVPLGKPRVVMALDEPKSYCQPTPITND